MGGQRAVRHLPPLLFTRHAAAIVASHCASPRRSAKNLRLDHAGRFGDGEGRDGVWLAEQGWSVTSLDYSQEGIAKTQQLATQRGVALETICADASQWDYPEAHFDLIVLFYFHLPREAAKVAHRGCVKALRPGGRLILEGFRKEQMPLSSGGPRVEDWVYSAEEINEDFGTLDARISRAVGRVLREGRLHGSAAVYQYVGHKAE